MSAARLRPSGGDRGTGLAPSLLATDPPYGRVWYLHITRQPPSVLLVHLTTTVFRLAGPGGLRDHLRPGVAQPSRASRSLYIKDAGPMLLTPPWIRETVISPGLTYQYGLNGVIAVRNNLVPAHVSAGR